MHLRLALAGLALPALLWLTTGCQGKPLPLTAVQGSSMVIPLEAPTEYDWSIAPIGYGGSAVPEDYQRGRLVYQLTDGVDGPLVLDANGQPIELDTRVSATVAPSQRAPQGTLVRSLGSETLVSLVDIPLTAPTGSFGLHVLNRRIEGGQVVERPWDPGRQPSSEFEIVAGSGQSTPFEIFFGGWTDASSEVPLILPQPAVELRVRANCVLTECSTSAPSVGAVELEVLYPASVIDVASVTSTRMTGPASFWSEDDGAGLIRVSGVNPNGAVGSAYLIFTLDDGSLQILDLPDITTNVLKGTDINGVEISGEWEVVAEPLAIW